MMDIMRLSDGTLTAHFEPIEVDLLRLATSQLIDLLTDAASDLVAAAADPALRRLLPDAYRNDPEAAAEFRRFTADDLLESKIQTASTVLGALAEIDADDESAGTIPVPIDTTSVQSWLRTLTDLRLTLAERLMITTDGAVGLEGEEAEFLGELYDWLGAVQESLVYAVDI